MKIYKAKSLVSKVLSIRLNEEVIEKLDDEISKANELLKKKREQEEKNKGKMKKSKSEKNRKKESNSRANYITRAEVISRILEEEVLSKKFKIRV